MALELVVAEDAAQVRVAPEGDAEQVPDLALGPVGAAVEVADRVDGLVLGQVHLHLHAVVLLPGPQQVDHLEALVPLREVHADHVRELLAALLVAQVAHHVVHALPGHGDGFVPVVGAGREDVRAECVLQSFDELLAHACPSLGRAADAVPPGLRVLRPVPIFRMVRDGPDAGTQTWASLKPWCRTVEGTRPSFSTFSWISVSE